MRLKSGAWAKQGGKKWPTKCFMLYARAYLMSLKFDHLENSGNVEMVDTFMMFQ